jgi:hypothetical protein
VCRYKINLTERGVVDGKTGEVLRPACFDTLSAYHSYLIGSGKKDVADDLLRRLFKGEKVISNMIEQAQKHQLI